MKKLTDNEIIRIIKEEWSKKIAALSEDVDLMFKAKVDGEEINPISSGLKVKSKKTGITYTVEEVGPDSVRLLSPDGDDALMINGKDLEDNYELD